MATETLPLAIAKRLSFGDVSLHAPNMFDSTQVLRSLKEPSLENFQKALDFLSSANIERFHRVKDAAREAAPGSGDSDLRRLKKQFKSLKSNFVQFDVKEGFMEALLQGRPADTEEEFLAQVQQEVDQVNVELRQVKGRNKEMRDELGVVIEAVCGCIADFAVKQREVNAELASIKGLAEAEGRRDESLPLAARTPTAPLLALGAADTPERTELLQREEALKLSVGAAADVARQMEAATATLRARCQDAQLAVEREAGEVAALEAELRALEASSRSERCAEGALRTAAEALAWTAQMTTLLETLSGVSVTCSAPGSLALTLTTHVLAGGALRHDLTLGLFTDGVVKEAALSPSDEAMDAELRSMVQLARSLNHGADYIVREVRAMLDTRANGGSASGF